MGSRSWNVQVPNNMSKLHNIEKGRVGVPPLPVKKRRYLSRFRQDLPLECRDDSPPLARVGHIDGRVALGSYPPRAPTDPDVHALAHPVPRPTGSPSAMVPVAIQSSDGDMWIELRCTRHVSLDWVCRPTLRFPPQGPPERVPLLQRYYQSVTTSCRPSRRTSLPSFGGTSVALVVFAPRRTSAPPRPGVGHPVSPAGISPRKRQDLPSSWGTTIVRLRMFPSDAGRTACTRPLQCSSVAPERPSAEAPTIGTFDAQ